MYSYDRFLPGTPYTLNALAFAVIEDGRAIPFGWEPSARQELIDGNLPLVQTRWHRGDWEIVQTAFGRPLHGDTYTTGQESTLGWEVFEVTNLASHPREFTLLATRMGNNEKPIRELSYSEGVVKEGKNSRFSAKAPRGFHR